MGAITVYASGFASTANGWSASGTVWIGEYTIVENATVTLSNGALSGSGLVSFMTTSNGSQRTTLFQDSFSVNTSTGNSSSGVLTPQSAAGHQLKMNNLVGFRVNQGLYNLSIDTANGVVVGNLSLQLVVPDNAVTGTVQFRLDHTGHLIGALTGPPATFQLGPLSLDVAGAVLGSDGLTIINATWKMPDELGGLKVSLNVKDARITGDGQFILGSGSASVALPNMSFGGDQGFKMEGASATLSYEFGRYTFHGQGKFHIPGLKTLPGGCDELDPSFTLTTPPLGISQVSISVSGCKYEIADVFGVPIYVTGVHGNFDLTTGKIVIEVGISLQVADDLPPLGAILSGDFNAHWDSSWSISLTGTARLFTWPLESVSLTLDARNGLVGTFHSVNYGAWQTMDGRIHLWGDANHFHFTGTGTLTLGVPKGAVDQDCSGLLCFPLPPFDMTGPSVSAQFGEFRTPTSATPTYGFKGIVDLIFLKPAFFVGTDGHAQFNQSAVQHFQLIDQASGTNSVRRNTAGAMDYSASIGATPTAVIGIAFDSGAPTLTLTDPNGRILTATTSDPNVIYTAATGQIFYTITAPPAGNWTVTVGNLTGSEHYLVDVLGAPLAAAITQIPSLAPATNGYTITTQATGASGATYSLYYDTDATGADGKPIATGLPITRTQATWDTRTVPNGSYYVYALLDDLTNAPVVAYSASPVTISDATPPAVPINLHATATGSDLSVSWQPSPDVDVAGYHVAYQQPGAGQTFTDDVPDGQASSATIHGLNINGNWSVSISAYDLNGNESVQSGAVAVPVSAVQTFSLTVTAGGTATANPPATTYAPDTVVTLTATTSAGYTFTGWTVDGADAGKANPLPLTATSSDAVVANFAPLPAIIGASPSSGSTNGGGGVTIIGTGFIAPATVTFDGIAATTTAISADLTQITVTPPAHGVGTVGIAITTPLGSVPLANAYTYGNVVPLPPSQPSVAPGGPPSPLPPVRPAPVGAPPSPPQPLPNPRP